MNETLKVTCNFVKVRVNLSSGGLWKWALGGASVAAAYKSDGMRSEVTEELKYSKAMKIWVSRIPYILLNSGKDELSICRYIDNKKFLTTCPKCILHLFILNFKSLTVAVRFLIKFNWLINVFPSARSYYCWLPLWQQSRNEKRSLQVTDTGHPCTDPPSTQASTARTVSVSTSPTVP